MLWPLDRELVDATMANLKIIGRIQKNDKIAVRKGQLCIEKPGKLTGLLRWLNRDSRDVTLLHLKGTITAAVQIGRRLLTERDLVSGGRWPPGGGGCPADSGGDPPDWVLSRLARELHGCETGLANLRATYMDDAQVVAQLDVLLDRVAVYSSTLETHGGARVSTTSAYPTPYTTPDEHTAFPAEP
jgi:hypothetical protein